VRGRGRARSGQEEGRGRTPEGGRCRKEVGGRREKSSRRSPVTAAAAEMSSETLRPFGLRKQVLVSSHSKRRNSGPNSGIHVHILSTKNRTHDFPFMGGFARTESNSTEAWRILRDDASSSLIGRRGPSSAASVSSSFSLVGENPVS
jgi:hypothetical protein